MASLPGRLTPANREVILAIKQEWAGREEYGTSVTSADIYTAVLDGGVLGGADSTDWLAARAGGGVATLRP